MKRTFLLAFILATIFRHRPLKSFEVQIYIKGSSNLTNHKITHPLTPKPGIFKKQILNLASTKYSSDRNFRPFWAFRDFLQMFEFESLLLKSSLMAQKCKIIELRGFAHLGMYFKNFEKYLQTWRILVLTSWYRFIASMLKQWIVKFSVDSFQFHPPRKEGKRWYYQRNEDQFLLARHLAIWLQSQIEP